MTLVYPLSISITLRQKHKEPHTTTTTPAADIVAVLHRYHSTTATSMIGNRMFDAESLDTIATTARAASLTPAHTAKGVAFQMAAALGEIERIMLNEEEYARLSPTGQEAIRLANSLAVVAIGGVMDLFVKEDDVSVRWYLDGHHGNHAIL